MARMAHAWSGTGYRRGVRTVAPLAAAIGTLGVVFGYLARASGLSAGASIAMSVTTFAGSPQFAAISVFAAGGTIVAAVAAAAALATRFGAMSATAAPSLRGPFWKRVLLSQLVVDETWAVAYAGGKGFDRELLIGAGLTLYIVHVGSTALGAAFGNFLGEPQRWGVDAMSPALFIVLLAPRLDNRKAWLTVGTVAAVTVATIPLVPPGVPILVAIGLVGALALLPHQPLRRGKGP
jgi:predicted branched-subunit amino acid permease